MIQCEPCSADVLGDLLGSLSSGERSGVAVARVNNVVREGIHHAAQRVPRTRPQELDMLLPDASVATVPAAAPRPPGPPAPRPPGPIDEWWDL